MVAQNNLAHKNRDKILVRFSYPEPSTVSIAFHCISLEYLTFKHYNLVLLSINVFAHAL